MRGKGAAQIMQGAIVTEKLELHAPDILVRPDVDAFRALEDEIAGAAEA